jgi:multiple sugar transport system substrate-binding protein
VGARHGGGRLQAADVCLITNDWALLKGGKNPEAAWRLLEWFSGDDGQRLIAEEDQLPANLKVAQAQAYTRLDSESRQAALRALETGRPLPYDAPLWGEVRPMWENELPGVWRGETTARDLMQRVVPLVNEKLKAAPR